MDLGSACEQAAISSALGNERLKVDVTNHLIKVHLDDVCIVRMSVDAGESETTIVIEQEGLGMIDGQTSLVLMESTKVDDAGKIYGGQYGIGLKQLLAVLAHLSNEGWAFSMFGSVFHESSGKRGWSRMWSSDVEAQLNIHGEVWFGGMGKKVRHLNYVNERLF